MKMLIKLQKMKMQKMMMMMMFVMMKWMLNIMLLLTRIFQRQSLSNETEFMFVFNCHKVVGANDNGFCFSLWY